jgi:hypothetical protein
MTDVLSGIEFKKKHGTVFYKFISKNMIHHNFEYKLGLNVDIIPFDPNSCCRPGGLYFTTLKYIIDYYEHGSILAEIGIIDDSLIYIDDLQQFKANKFNITKLMKNEIDIIEIFQLAMKNGCKMNTNVCVNTAEHGHLEVLVWAKKKDVILLYKLALLLPK